MLARSSISRICSGVTGLVVAEVEAQPVGRDERALLLHVVAEHLAQRPVQDVGAGVVAADRVAARRRRSRRVRLLTGRDLAVGDARDVAVQAGQRVVSCRAPRPGPVSVVIRAGVADLTAGLGVEGRAVEDDVDLVAVAGTTASTVALVSTPRDR